MVTPYTTGGQSLSYLNGMEKVGDSLFALYSNKIYEIGLTDNTTSPDNWTSSTSGTTKDLYGVSYGNNTFVTVGKDGKIFTSPDGTTWTAQTSGTTKDFQGVAYGNNTFVAVGNDGKIFTSDNGTTWTAQTSGVQIRLVKVTFSTDKFVAVGYSG
ncbi:MAG: hypothetical protein QF704_18010, partial [Anaerolineales bacterium]|nr:hypothetical protein [Anaerolineales bacterium]